jgi:1-phosphofructokinase
VSNPAVTVFTPTPLLTISIERNPDGSDDIHLHVGGQGVWVARMLRSLGCEPLICGPFGGEPGSVARLILTNEGFDVRAVGVERPTAVNLEDGRDDRHSIVHTEPFSLDRHELDYLYGVALAAAVDSRCAVITGSRWTHVLPTETFSRLSGDLAAVGIPVVADLSGDQLNAVLEHGVRILKVSDAELEDHGLLPDRGEEAVVKAIDDLHRRGAHDVVISRGGEPAIALIDKRRYRVVAPSFDVVESAGSGDSMTAALAAGVATDMDPEALLALAAAAGAVNVTRHGLGGADPQVVRRMAESAVAVAALGSP